MIWDIRRCSSWTWYEMCPCSSISIMMHCLKLTWIWIWHHLCFSRYMVWYYRTQVDKRLAVLSTIWNSFTSDNKQWDKFKEREWVTSNSTTLKRIAKFHLLETNRWHSFANEIDLSLVDAFKIRKLHSSSKWKLVWIFKVWSAPMPRIEILFVSTPVTAIRVQVANKREWSYPAPAWRSVNQAGQENYGYLWFWQAGWQPISVDFNCKPSRITSLAHQQCCHKSIEQTDHVRIGCSFSSKQHQSIHCVQRRRRNLPARCG